jgi:hypothetical protein
MKKTVISILDLSLRWNDKPSSCGAPPYTSFVQESGEEGPYRHQEREPLFASGPLREGTEKEGHRVRGKVVCVHMDWLYKFARRTRTAQAIALDDKDGKRDQGSRCQDSSTNSKSYTFALVSRGRHAYIGMWYVMVDVHCAFVRPLGIRPCILRAHMVGDGACCISPTPDTLDCLG